MVLILTLLFGGIAVAAESNLMPFDDVPDGAWYGEAVRFAYYRGVMTGVGGAAFDPDGAASRAMIVTVLWRMAGSPAPAAESGFSDLTQNWYRDAAAWAREAGIANGVSADRFDPNGAVTREQLAAFLARFAARIFGVDTGTDIDLSDFPDGEAASAYAKAPLAWAVRAGIITGTAQNGQTLLAPRNKATRAQIAAMLMRLYRMLPREEATAMAERVDRMKIAEKTNQIVVVADHSLTLWERGADGAWAQTLDAYAGYGYNGMSESRSEGDGTTPIGAFPLLYAFGRDADADTDMEYRVITDRSYFSAERSDGTYNTWVESDTPVYGEHLMDYAGLQYRLAAVIGFNIDPVTVGMGSAIFLHCKGNSWNTAGCVSVERSVMEGLLARLHPGAWIVIVRSQGDLAAY